MDNATLKSLGAKVTLVRVGYSRKLGDGNYGSIGGEVSAEATIAADVDADAATKALYEWCKTHVADSMKQVQEAVQRPLQGPHLPPEAPKPAPVPATPEPTRTPVDDQGNEYTEFDVTHFTVHEMDGKRSAKVFGPRFIKFGVRAWPEVMKLAGIDIAVCNTGTEYEFPGNIKKAVAVLNDKGNPQKVTSFA